MSDVEVLVVGAGPVGLTMACELQRYGVPFRIVDKNEGPQIWSKAAAAQARTLEVWQDMGVLEELREFGRPMYGANIYRGSERIAHLALKIPDTPYQYIFGISQRRVELELARHLEERGVKLERPVELLGFDASEDGVTATLKHPDGREEMLRARWLIGCDGAKSTVRGILGLPFEGSTHAQTLVQADIRVKFPFEVDPREAVMFTSPNGPIGALPLLDDGRYRLIAIAPPDPEAEPTLELFQQLVKDRCAEGVEVSDPAWMVKFHFHGRIVPKYRVGRVFLAGDAGHIHSPVGAQGMNLGIQDAYNLAWKLGHVIHGAARPEILDSYDAERRPIGQAVVDTTDRATKGMMRMLTLRSPLAQALRNQLVTFLFNSGMFQEFVFRGVGGVAVGYAGSPIVGEHVTSVWQANVVGGDAEHPKLSDWYAFQSGPGPGARVPDVELEQDNGTLFELLRGTRHVLLLFDGAATTPAGYARMAEIVDRVARRYGEWIRTYAVVPNAERPGTLPDSIQVLHDPEMSLHQHFGCPSEALYLIRPDGYVGFRSQPADSDAIFRYLEQILVA